MKTKNRAIETGPAFTEQVSLKLNSLSFLDIAPKSETHRHPLYQALTHALHGFKGLCTVCLLACTSLGPLSVQAVLTVTNLNDGGPGSLRQAIADASPGETIRFEVAGTVVLTAGELVIDKDLTIAGSGATNLAISGNFNSRVFSVVSNVTAVICDLAICDGRTSDGVNGSWEQPPGSGERGGGICNWGNLTLTRCIISNNRTGNGGSGGVWDAYPWQGGRGGDGGAIYNANWLALIDCLIASNSTGCGGSGGVSYPALTGSDGGPGGDGGAIYTDAWCSLCLSNCVLSGNATGNGGVGGGLYGWWSCGKGADGGAGGAVLNGRGATLTLYNCILADNLTGNGGLGPPGLGWPGSGGDGGPGGAVYTAGNANMVYCELSGNAAGSGGSGGGSDTVDGGDAGNGGLGGGIYNAVSGSLGVKNCFINANMGGNGGDGGQCGGGIGVQAGDGGDGGDGGGVFNMGAMTATSSTFSGNAAGKGGKGGEGTSSYYEGLPGGGGGRGGSGGGIFNAGHSLLINCTLSANTNGIGGNGGNGGSFSGGKGGDGGGGGEGGSGSLSCAGGTNILINCTIVDNHAAAGGTGGLGGEGDPPGYQGGWGTDGRAGGVFGSAQLVNTVVALNHTFREQMPDVYGVFVSLGHNLVGITNGSAGFTNADLVGSSITPLDPGIRPLGYYGSQMPTCALFPGSPAINAGDNNGFGARDVDQRGFPRIVCGTIDIGAVEFQGCALLPPLLVVQPTNQTVRAGTNATFYVGVEASPDTGYQWRKAGTNLFDGGNVFGSSTPVLMLSNILAADAGDYSVVISNAWGCITSALAMLTVIDPAIVMNPVSLKTNAGSTVTFSVVAAGTAPLAYQWFKHNALLPEACGSTLTLSNVLGADSGSYWVVVSNRIGTATSTVATLMVVDPIIAAQPVTQNRNAGEIATLSVTAVGTEPMYYRWYKDGIGFDWRPESSLTLSNLQGSDAGAYRVVVTNIWGRATSAVAVLTVNIAFADAEFDPGPDGPVYAIALQPDGKILVTGSFTSVGGRYWTNIARLNPAGTPDINFNPAAVGPVNSLAVQTDRKIIVGGSGRLNADGSLDTGFNPGVEGSIEVVALQPDGKILVGGLFTKLAGEWVLCIGRLNPDASLDTSFSASADWTVLSLAIQPDGKILVGGNFAFINLIRRVYFARLYSNGGVETGFNPPAFGPASPLAVQQDGKILVGWGSRLSRLNEDGTEDTGYNPNANGPVRSIALQTDGKVLVGGSFTSIGGQWRTNIARLNPDGTADVTFNPGANGPVHALALQPDGRIILGGNFTSVAGQNRTNIARLNNTGPATESLSFDGSAITWLRSGTSPEAWWTAFETSSDGTNWTEIGAGTRIANGWRLTGVTLAPGAMIRARGYIGPTCSSGSSWFVETSASAPRIIAGPTSATNFVGATATFSVIATGTPPLSYQWLKNGSALANGGTVYGAQSSMLVLSNLLAGDAGSYFVVVSNEWGSTTSTVAWLEVRLPSLEVEGEATDGLLWMTARGCPGSAYEVLVSTNLVDWCVLDTITNQIGSVTFAVPVTNAPASFYRLRQLQW